MSDITEVLSVNILQSWTITWWKAMSTHCTWSNHIRPCFSPFHISYVCEFRPLVANCPIRMQQRKKRNDLSNLRVPFYRHVPIQHPADSSLDTLGLLGKTALLSTWGHFLTMRAGLCTLQSFKAGDEIMRSIVLLILPWKFTNVHSTTNRIAIKVSSYS